MRLIICWYCHQAVWGLLCQEVHYYWRAANRVFNGEIKGCSHCIVLLNVMWVRTVCWRVCVCVGLCSRCGDQKVFAKKRSELVCHDLCILCGVFFLIFLLYYCIVICNLTYLDDLTVDFLDLSLKIEPLLWRYLMGNIQREGLNFY